jgi:hypothetical protein
LEFALFVAAIATMIAVIIRFRRTKYVFLIMVASWLGYFLWNEWVLSDCGRDCWMRYDIPFVAPIPLLATGLALAEAIRRRRNKR